MTFYFFTDDNFARNQAWNEIFDALIDLRENEQIPVEFMMQVDVLSYKIKGFVEKARRAGCSNVFIGMESINDDNLKAAKKRQNHVDDYRNLIDAYRSAEIATHVGYILGFPFDSPESISRDLHKLTHEVRPDMASFFILTPLPGSRDHWEMYRENRYMDPDYNKYDSQHETMNYPYFPDEGSLLAAYRNAWRTFYSFENMSRILRRAPQTQLLEPFRQFLLVQERGGNREATSDDGRFAPAEGPPKGPGRHRTAAETRLLRQPGAGAGPSGRRQFSTVARNAAALAGDPLEVSSRTAGAGGVEAAAQR